tara:strand:+ start:787 stop:918 length:132 start_codon:yes stop_codon:yes gene_type:complete
MENDMRRIERRFSYRYITVCVQSEREKMPVAQACGKRGRWVPE